MAKARQGSSKNREPWPSPSQAAREALGDVSRVSGQKETLREFDALQYEQPPEYSSSDIVHLRTRKMGMSQAVFAMACNIRLGTLQKWERGVRRPTPPMNRLFQLIERDALRLVSRR